MLARANAQWSSHPAHAQLLVIPTHSTFALIQDVDEIEMMLAEHRAIYDFLLAERNRRQWRGSRLTSAARSNPYIERLKRIGFMPEVLRPPFLFQVAARN